jgi:hypothetical protein
MLRFTSLGSNMLFMFNYISFRFTLIICILLSTERCFFVSNIYKHKGEDFYSLKTNFYVQLGFTMNILFSLGLTSISLSRTFNINI